jgi:hypothetical protein
VGLTTLKNRGDTFRSSLHPLLRVHHLFEHCHEPRRLPPTHVCTPPATPAKYLYTPHGRLPCEAEGPLFRHLALDAIVLPIVCNGLKQLSRSMRLLVWCGSAKLQLDDLTARGSRGLAGVRGEGGARSGVVQTMWMVGGWLVDGWGTPGGRLVEGCGRWRGERLCGGGWGRRSGKMASATPRRDHDGEVRKLDSRRLTCLAS